MKVLSYSNSYGAVMGGDSRKLKKCFKSYMLANRAEVFNIIQRNIEKVKVRTDLLLIEQFTVRCPAATFD
jgi:hypothetical protein